MKMLTPGKLHIQNVHIQKDRTSIYGPAHHIDFSIVGSPTAMIEFQNANRLLAMQKKIQRHFMTT